MLDDSKGTLMHLQNATLSMISARRKGVQRCWANAQCAQGLKRDKKLVRLQCGFKMWMMKNIH